MFKVRKTVLLLCLAVILISGCSDNITETTIKKDEKVTINNKSETKNETNKVTIEQVFVKDKADLKQLVEDDLKKANISTDNIKFESLKPDIAVVDDKGIIISNKAGTTPVNVIDTTTNKVIKQIEINTSPPGSSPSPSSTPGYNESPVVNNSSAGTDSSTVIKAPVLNDIEITGSYSSFNAKLSWSTVPNAVQYKVFRDGESVAVLDTNTFTDQKLSLSSYNYYVAACNASGCSPLSNSKKANQPLLKLRTIAFNAFDTVKGTGKLFVMNDDGSTILQLSPEETVAIDNAPPKWSPDGTKVAYISKNSGLHIINKDGSNLIVIGQTGNINNVNWSPDSKKLIIAKGDITASENEKGIFSINADGSDFKKLFQPKQYLTVNHPYWSPDGSKIVFHYLGRDEIISYGYTKDIYVINSDGSNPVNITNSPQEDDISPLWSPDGSRIAFQSISVNERDSNGKIKTYYQDIVSIKPDGTDKRILGRDSHPNFDIVWSPDGSKIAYLTNQYMNNVNIVRKDGGSIVTYNATCNNFLPPRWSPDSSKILVIDCDAIGNKGFFLFDIEKNKKTPFSINNVYDLRAFDWSLR